MNNKKLKEQLEFTAEISAKAEDSIRKALNIELPKEVRIVIRALANCCFSYGKCVGYDQGQHDANHGKDDRIPASQIHLN